MPTTTPPRPDDLEARQYRQFAAARERDTPQAWAAWERETSLRQETLLTNDLAGCDAWLMGYSSQDYLPESEED